MRSVRLRLLLLAVLPLAVLMPLLLGMTMWRWIDQFDRLLIAKVESDLRIADQYLHRIEDTQAAEVAALARSVGFADAQARGEAALDRFLEVSAVELGLDFLILGRVADESLPADAMDIVRAGDPDEPSAGLAVLSAQALAQLSPDLAERARLSLVPTEAARPIDWDEETRGMVLLAAQRVMGSRDILVGGRLLNRNLDFIDTMNDLVYRGADEADARAGTTTLFLDDVRISTNVRLFEGSRALGTRVSEAVWREVMEGGETWLDRAFVVNDWYISGYQPITDVSGNRIGMLYTGFLETPFSTQRTAIIVTLVIAFVAVCGLSVPVFLHLARGVFKPLEQMTATMARVENGTLDARIGTVRSDDEIGAVAKHLDRLLDQVQERDEALRGYADNLNELVDQRTEELRDANRRLEETFAQLVMKEKLASIGEITAGVAHEINNPVAVIQGNLEVVRAQLGERADAYRTELDLIDAQTHRIHAIVGKLLNFTRSSDIADGESLVDPAQAVKDALVLVAADLRTNTIELEESYGDAGPVRIVETELQQVLVNLMINAVQAMPDGGRLMLATRTADRDGATGVEISVTDTGAGIDAAVLEQVFDPFFTTKLAEGTGLGLSISQALVTKAGGMISVRNVPAGGASFSVWLPRADNLSGPSEQVS